MKKKILSLILTVLIIFSAVGCFTSCTGEKEYPVTIGDVTVKSEPEYIVVLDKNLQDIISCMFYDVKLIGRSKAVNQEGLDVVEIVGGENDPDPEKIAELGANLVIADKSLDESIAKKIEAKGVQVVRFDVAETKAQLKNLYENIGKVLGGNITGKENATEAYSEFIETLDNIKFASKADISVPKTVCYLYIDDGILKTFNGNFWGGIMLENTGGINVFEHSETDVIDSEQLLLSNPDYIFCSSQEVIDYLNNSNTLYTLNALDGNCFVVPFEDITMQGYTALDTLQVMLKNMYPESFSEENSSQDSDY